MTEKRVADFDLRTVTGVRAAVALVGELGELDDEVAHSEEDALHVGVLTAIAAGAGTPWALAQEALATAEFDFARWCA